MAKKAPARMSKRRNNRDQLALRVLINHYRSRGPMTGRRALTYVPAPTRLAARPLQKQNVGATASESALTDHLGQPDSTTSWCC